MNLYKNSKSKILLGIILASSIFISSGMSVKAAPTVKDLDSSSDYAKASIEELIANNVIQGDQSGNFNPLNTITRAEMVTLMVKAFGIDTSDTPDQPTFKDIPKEHWAYKYVEAAYKNNLIKGVSPEVFDANQQCTREQLAVIFIRSIGIKDSDLIGKQKLMLTEQLKDKGSISSWSRDFIEFALDSGLMQGTGNNTFNAEQSAQREQAAVLVYRIIQDKDTLLKYYEAYSGNVNYPELFNILRNNYYAFNGQIESGFAFTMTDNVSKETINMKMDSSGKIDNQNYDMTYHFSSAIPSQEPIDKSFMLIKADGQLYLQDEAENQWYIRQEEELGQSGIFRASSIVNPSILINYSHFPITAADIETASGEKITRYTITITKDSIQQLLPIFFAGDQPLKDEDIEALLNSNFDCKIVIDINDKNQVVDDDYSLNATIQSSENNQESVTVSSRLSTNYTNVGNISAIKAPIYSDNQP